MATIAVKKERKKNKKKRKRKKQRTQAQKPSEIKKIKKKPSLELILHGINTISIHITNYSFKWQRKQCMNHWITLNQRHKFRIYKLKPSVKGKRKKEKKRIEDNVLERAKGLTASLSNVCVFTKMP